MEESRRRGRLPRYKREGRERPSIGSEHPYWTSERTSAAPGAPFPARLTFVPREPEPPHLLDMEKDGAPPRIVRAGRPTFWRAVLTGQDPYEARRILYALLASDLGIAAERLVVTDGPCVLCGMRHGFTAGDGVGGGARIHFGAVTEDRTAVYSLSDTAVGLGLGRLLGPSLRAGADARSVAHRGAYDQMAVRGLCGPKRMALPADLAYVAAPGDLAVTAIWHTPPEATPS